MILITFNNHCSIPKIQLDQFRIFIFSSEIKEKNPHFGTSLLLANIGPNSAMSPKIVNGSFAALFDNNDVFQDFSRRLQDLGMDAKDSGWKLTS